MSAGASLAAQAAPRRLCAVLPAGGTVAGARRALARAFREAGLDSPETDARLLVGHALGLDRAALLGAAARVLTPDENRTIDALSYRRLKREPLALIVGVREFWSLPFAVNRATLIPRPDTETVVEAALSAVDNAGFRTRALRIADLGVGSGAILIALLSELPNAAGVGVDVSMAAVALARENAQRLGLTGRTAFFVGDFASALGGGFDLVVSNPPYIAAGEIASLAPEVRDYEPRLAIDGGADGLAAYRAIAADARRLLAPDGVLVLEIGRGQAEAVATIMSGAGLAPTGAAHADLTGVPRGLILGRR